MLTVHDTLQLDIFAGADLVAGHAGAGRAVSWVHNVGVPDAANWVNGGELVLTTAFTMPESPAEQQAYVEALADRGVAGLAIAVGRYIKQVPGYLMDVADARDLPLIAIPFATRFVEVAREVNERITQANVSTVRRALEINQRLSRLVLDSGGGLDELARVLADLIGQSVSIETDRFEKLAACNIAEVDEARRYTLLHGRTNPHLIETLRERGILDELQQQRRPVMLPKIPEVGLELERILAPVVVHDDIYGYMWIIADGSPLTDLDRMAIESGATIAALILLHQEAMQSAEASLKGSLLSQLIQGERDRETVLTDQALRYGVDLNRAYRLLLLENGSDPTRHYRRVNRLVSEQAWPAVVGQFAGQVLVLAAGDARRMAGHVQVNGWRVGVSGEQRGPAGVAIAHGQCREVLQIARLMNDPAKTVCFDDLGYLHALYIAGPASLEGNPHVPALRILMDETSADLFNTLEAYLDAGGNGVATAEVLHVHRSTLNYRLQRIAEIADADLSVPEIRLNLQIALKLLRLFPG